MASARRPEWRAWLQPRRRRGREPFGAARAKAAVQRHSRHVRLERYSCRRYRDEPIKLARRRNRAGDRSSTTKENHAGRNGATAAPASLARRGNPKRSSRIVKRIAVAYEAGRGGLNSASGSCFPANAAPSGRTALFTRTVQARGGRRLGGDRGRIALPTKRGEMRDGGADQHIAGGRPLRNEGDASAIDHRALVRPVGFLEQGGDDR